MCRCMMTACASRTAARNSWPGVTHLRSTPDGKRPFISRSFSTNHAQVKTRAYHVTTIYEFQIERILHPTTETPTTGRYGVPSWAPPVIGITLGIPSILVFEPVPQMLSFEAKANKESRYESGFQRRGFQSSTPPSPGPDRNCTGDQQRTRKNRLSTKRSSGHGK